MTVFTNEFFVELLTIIIIKTIFISEPMKKNKNNQNKNGLCVWKKKIRKKVVINDNINKELELHHILNY